MAALSKKLVEQVGGGLFKGLLQHAISTGRIDPSGLTEEQIRARGLKLVEKYLAAGAQLKWIMDHTRNLLASAREEAKEGSLEMAVVHYATWVEHTLNKWIINVSGDRDKLSGLLIRETAVPSEVFMGLHRLWEDTVQDADRSDSTAQRQPKCFPSLQVECRGHGWWEQQGELGFAC